MSEPMQVDVAVVGGGPSGLAAAATLRRRNIGTVVVLEREPEAGGIPRHCAHPPYGVREFGRLMTGPTYAARLRAMAEQAGVRVLTGHSVISLDPGGRLQVATAAGPLTIQARRVILATGAREMPRSSRMIAGERPIGILNTGALQSYIHLKHLKPFRRPVVFGTELVGLSALWTCVSHGIRPVAVIEEASGSIARWPLGLFPRLLGIPIHFGVHITGIGGKPRVEYVDIVSGDGRVTRLECDGLLLTGRFVPEAALIRTGVVTMDPGSGGPIIDQDGRCSDPAYFAVGNLLRPVENAGWCFGEGRRTGEVVAEEFSGLRPATGRSIDVKCGNDVKLSVPQKLSVPLNGAVSGHIQVRAERRSRGHLLVRAGDQVLWSRRIDAKPERRILIPIKDIALPKNARSIEIAIEQTSRR